MMTVRLSARTVFSKVVARKWECSVTTKAEHNVLPHPSLREIPEPMFPLKEAGRAFYDEMARLLYTRKQLTYAARVSLTGAALQVQAMSDEAGQGIMSSASRMTQLQRVINDLGLHDSKPIAAPEDAEESRWARNGYAARHKSPPGHSRISR